MNTSIVIIRKLKSFAVRNDSFHRGAQRSINILVKRTGESRQVQVANRAVAVSASPITVNLVVCLTFLARSCNDACVVDNQAVSDRAGDYLRAVFDSNRTQLTNLCISIADHISILTITPRTIQPKLDISSLTCQALFSGRNIRQTA